MKTRPTGINPTPSPVCCTDINAYLNEEIDKIVRKRRLTIAVGATLLIVFYFASMFLLAWVNEQLHNPVPIMTSVISALLPEPVVSQNWFEKEATSFAPKISKNISRNSLNYPNKFCRAFQEELEIQISAFFENLNPTLILSDILSHEPKTIHAMISHLDKGESSQTNMETQLQEVLSPKINAIWNRYRQFGQFDTFLAIANTINNIQTKKTLTPEEQIEYQLLTLVSMITSRPSVEKERKTGGPY